MPQARPGRSGTGQGSAARPGRAAFRSSSAAEPVSQVRGPLDHQASAVVRGRL